MQKLKMNVRHPSPSPTTGFRPLQQPVLQEASVQADKNTTPQTLAEMTGLTLGESPVIPAQCTEDRSVGPHDVEWNGQADVLGSVENAPTQRQLCGLLTNLRSLTTTGVVIKELTQVRRRGLPGNGVCRRRDAGETHAAVHHSAGDYRKGQRPSAIARCR